MTAKKKVWILDGGSLVIDRSQVLWHIDVGTPVRFPAQLKGVGFDPEQVSFVVNSHFHLASEEAHWITGQMLTADGGHTRH
jgi:NAD(P)-dependent dehydrogenase (short-subunit alcohol dehydrogenase family)